MLYLLQEWSKLLEKVDPWDEDNNSQLQATCRLLGPSLRDTVNELLERADHPDVEETVKRTLMSKSAGND